MSIAYHRKIYVKIKDNAHRCEILFLQNCQKNVTFFWKQSFFGTVCTLFIYFIYSFRRGHSNSAHSNVLFPPLKNKISMWRISIVHSKIINCRRKMIAKVHFPCTTWSQMKIWRSVFIFQRSNSYFHVISVIRWRFLLCYQCFYYLRHLRICCILLTLRSTTSSHLDDFFCLEISY